MCTLCIDEMPYCAFDIFQKVVFCLTLYTEVNLQTFVMIKCKTICRYYLYTKSFILVIGFLKNQIFSVFPIVKTKPNHAEICKVGNLEPDFQLVSFVQFF